MIDPRLNPRRSNAFPHLHNEATGSIRPVLGIMRRSLTVQGRADLRCNAIVLGDSVPEADPAVKVSMRPAWKGDNPYTTKLANALAARDVVVRELGYAPEDMPRDRSVVLIHWPNEFFVQDNGGQARHALKLLAKLWTGKLLRRQKLVWVAHNALPHNREGRSSGLIRTGFLKAVDGLVFLSRVSRDRLLEQWPALRPLPYAIVSHGHYRDEAISPRTLPPSTEGRPARLAFIGRVMRYKAPEVLAETVAALPPGEAALHIAGQCDDPVLRADLEAIARRSPAVTLDLKYLSDAEIEAATDGADAVILPYRDILNSGSTLFALSRSRPVVAPRLGSLTELLDQVGSDWLRLYDGDFGSGTLVDALAWLRSVPRRTEPDLSQHEWPLIADTMARFLRDVAAER